MAEQIPNNFQISGEAAVASYDFFDIAEGTGIKVFYGMDNETSAGATQDSLGNAIIAVDGETTTTGSTYNFDLAPFNLPKIITGTAYFQCALKGGTNGGDDIYVTAQLQKWDGTTATNITSAVQSATIIGQAIGWVTFPLTCTKTHFKKGEILRLVVVSTMGAGTGWFSHSPTNRDTTQFAIGTGGGEVPSSQMLVLVPFDLDL